MSTVIDGKKQGNRLYPSTRVYRALANPAAFTDAQVEEFRRSGFVAIENVFTAREIEDARAGLSHLVSGANPDFQSTEIEASEKDKVIPPHEREFYTRKIMSFVEFEPRLKAMSSHPVLMSIVKRLVGTDVTLAQDMALLKPPYCGTEKPWHQDTAYFLFDPPQGVLGTWTALDEATPENGCMYVVPGSHLLGTKAHFHARDCQIPDDEIDVDRAVAVPLKVGGVLFFGGLLHHGTPPNHSPSRRRALQFHYASVNCKKMDSKRHGELFHDGKEYAGCAAWADPEGKLKMKPIAERRAE